MSINKAYGVFRSPVNRSHIHRHQHVYSVFLDALVTLFQEEDQAGVALSRVQDLDLTGVWTHEGIVVRQMVPLRDLNFAKKSE